MSNMDRLPPKEIFRGYRTGIVPHGVVYEFVSPGSVGLVLS